MLVSGDFSDSFIFGHVVSQTETSILLQFDLILNNNKLIILLNIHIHDFACICCLRSSVPALRLLKPRLSFLYFF